MNVCVRAVQTDDVGRLAGLFGVIADDQAAAAFFNPHSFDAANAARICHRQGIRSDEYFVATEGSESIGYGMLRGWDEGYEVPSFGVYVVPAARGQGVASAVLDFAIERARAHGARELMLKVYDDNLDARRLYEGRGFRFAERSPDGLQLVGRLGLS